MPARTRAERIRRLQRDLLSTERYVDALLVVQDHNGNELGRTGGRWDRITRRWDREAPVTPFVVRLKESQYEAAIGFFEWVASSRRGLVDPLRAVVMMLAGARGSGKTWFIGLMIVFVGLEWSSQIQYSVNLSTGQRREILDGIRECSRPSWILDECTDPRDPWLKFITWSTVAFVSSRNPKRLREAKLPIRAVHVNEAQDQPEDIYINAVSATRNLDGLTTIATNRPREEAGNWTSLAASGIQAAEIVGLYYQLDPRKNDAVSDVALDKRANAIRVVNPDAARADTDPNAPMSLAGPIAYAAFVPLPAEKGGHIGEPPLIKGIDGADRIAWEDITAELTARLIGSGIGFPYVAGVDFQRSPGVIGSVAKLYRTDRGPLPNGKGNWPAIVLAIIHQVGVRGVEPDFSQGLYAAGYRPAHGMDGPAILLIGDGTGDRQNANHNFAQPTSFVAMRTEGWKIVGPDKHWKHGIPWNPPVDLSRRQMHAAFTDHAILLGPRCREPCEGFPTLVDSFRRALVGPKGGLIERGHLQHGPDGVRYIAWPFLPRPVPPKPAPLSKKTLSKFEGLRLYTSG